MRWRRLRFAQARFDAKESALPVVLAGFSFGAFVQTKVAQSVAAQRLVLVGPAVRRLTSTTVPGDTIVDPRRGGRCRAAGGSVRVGAAAGAAHRRVPRLRPFLPRPAARICSARSPGCGTGTRWPRVPDSAHPTVRPAPRRGAISGAADDVVLRVAGLRKSYGAKEVVRGLSFEIRRGECFGLLGPNGAGKTTTLRCCLGLIEPDGGTIEMAGARIPEAARAARARVGVVPQQDNLDPDFTVTENLQVYGRYFGIDPAHARRAHSRAAGIRRPREARRGRRCARCRAA